VTSYEVVILPDKGYGGFANGINEQGVVVGATLDADLNPTPSWWIPGPPPSWWAPPEYTLGVAGPLERSAGQLTRVNSIDNAVGLGNSTLFNVNFPNSSGVTLPFTGAGDLNQELVVGGNQIWSRLMQKVVSTMPLLAGQSGQISPTGAGINNLGDVVGSAGEEMGFFYYTNQPMLWNMQQFPDGQLLVDINDKRMAVGSSQDVPAYFNLFEINPDSLPLPREIPFDDQTATPGEAGEAKAINSGNTIVGNLDVDYGYPFVYQVGQAGHAANLNDLATNKQGAVLSDASDINDAGQIVGMAYTDGYQAGYIATPQLGPLHWPPLVGLIVAIRDGLLRGGALEGQVRSWLPVIWNRLPPEQRETLISFAISNLAGQMTDPEARSQIQRIAAEAASRALDQSKRPSRPPLSPAQKERIEKARKSMLGRRGKH
jgi:hypothetical protein